MKCVMVMFDSLNRHMLPPYGCDWTHAPNFKRLAERTATFDASYVCSMPCMPARRDFHTGRPNFLHRSWGPLEPFDDSAPAMLKQQGVPTHLITDHYHYFEDGGCTYHPRYSSFEFFRGHEGDPWMGVVGGDDIEQYTGRNAQPNDWHRQDRINRRFMPREQDQPQHKTFDAGIDFIDRNHAADRWMLQIETFDPHEPFFSQRQYKDLFYDQHYKDYQGKTHDWPPYCEVTEGRDVVEHMRYEYASLLAMCDAKLGQVLDAMDRHAMWDDTMLVVWTDHGFLLGEHDCWAKCWTPFYEEIARTPFFVHDPRSPEAAGTRRQALVQPSIDLPVTLLNFFGLEPTKDMIGKDLAPVVRDDTPVREAAMFGLHGGHVNVTDGRHVYMRAPATEENQPLYNYTLMPTHMRGPFQPEELKTAQMHEPLSFTKDIPVMQIRRGAGGWGKRGGTKLFDLQADPRQEQPLANPEIEQRMAEHLVRLMRECDAPSEQYERLGLAAEPVAGSA